MNRPIVVDATELAAEDIWKLPADSLLARLATTPAGLTGAEAQVRIATYGPNTAANRVAFS